MKKRLSRALGLALLITTMSLAGCASNPLVTGTEAQNLVKAGAILVDVRSVEEFAGGHIEGALNIPIDDLEARQGELPKDKDIVLYCRSGGRSTKGKALLVAAGYTKVHNLGGMSNWK
jgi:rhodanese-related sulfurtransferase